MVGGGGEEGAYINKDHHIQAECQSHQAEWNDERYLGPP